MKKITLHSEFVYLFAIVFLAFAVAMTAAADFGVSMIVAPAYILSKKVPFITFGQAEYVIQGILFVLFCILIKKFKIIYFSSFLTGIIYGAMLDLIRISLPHLNPDITVPGSMPMPARTALFIGGMIMTSFSISLVFRTYFYPQVYDFFVKGTALHFGLDRNKFKICFDLSFLIISCIMTLLFFGNFVGVGVGTVIITFCNGLLIGFFGKLLDKYVNIVPLLTCFSQKFELGN